MEAPGDKVWIVSESRVDKVFVVTEGEYSDYRILAVFRTKEEAEEFVRPVNNPDVECWDDPEIEEYTLGLPEGRFYQVAHIVTLDANTGNEVYHPQTEIRLLPRDWSDSEVYGSGSDCKIEGTSVVSQEHALKVAAEARQKYLREKGI